jgi:non-heme chloroperoxidase
MDRNGWVCAVRESHEVTGWSGTRVAVRAAGPVDGRPIVLVHGWAQSGAVWERQLAGPLADEFRLYAPDLRGHGDSEVPRDGYDRPEAWAGDLRAVLDLAGAPALVVGWSYGGLVVTDYLRVHGTAGLAGIALVGAITEIGRGHPGGRVGPAMRAALPGGLSEDPAVAEAALTAFVTGMSAPASARPGWAARELLAGALAVPAFVRAALFARDVDSSAELAAVDVPTLVLHGRHDVVVEPSAGEYAAGLVPGAELTWFERSGHLPFLEERAAFDAAIAAHARVPEPAERSN